METKATGWREWLVRALLLALLLFLLRTDDHRLSPATAAAASHLFALEEWIVENVEDKWRHRARRLLPTQGLSREDQVERMEELFQVQEEVRSIRRDIARAAATDTVQDRETLDSSNAASRRCSNAGTPCETTSRSFWRASWPPSSRRSDSGAGQGCSRSSSRPSTFGST